jgi:lipopolysaccharide transport system permease protein
VQYVLPVASNILQFATPIAYSAAFAMTRLGPGLQKLFYFNPLAALLEAFRWSVLNTDFPPQGWLVWSLSVSVGMFWIGAMAFKQMEKKFADVI